MYGGTSVVPGRAAHFVVVERGSAATLDKTPSWVVKGPSTVPGNASVQ